MILKIPNGAHSSHALLFQWLPAIRLCPTNNAAINNGEAKNNLFKATLIRSAAMNIMANDNIIKMMHHHPNEEIKR